jgi:hypothetical protein
MKGALFLVLFLAFSLPGTAADIAPSHQQTSSVPGARFEVLQSTLAAKWTFRLDRYTGRVWHLVRTNDDDNVWEEMPVMDLNVQASLPLARDFSYSHLALPRGIRSYWMEIRGRLGSL